MDTGPAEELGARLATLLERLHAAQARYLDHVASQKALPYLLALGTLHLVALRERYDVGGGGRRDRGKSWASEAPTGLAPKWGTVTCWASAGKIEGIAFTWMYGREA